MSDAISLQSKRTMQKLMGTAPKNVFGVRHNKKGFIAGPYFSLRQARTHATNSARSEEDNKEISVIEYELIEVQTHTRLKQKGGI